MMYNDRPIENPRLQKALDQIRQVLERNGFAGGFMVISPDEAAFSYVLPTPWSAFVQDATTPMGFRIKASSRDPDGHARLEGAAHIVMTLMDFGAQTFKWTSDLKELLERAGLSIEHTPFNGQFPGNIVEQPKTSPKR